MSLGAGGSRERGGLESEGVRSGNGETSGSGDDTAWKVRGDTNGEWDGVEELRRRTLAGAGTGQEEGAEGGEWDVRLRGRQI